LASRYSPSFPAKKGPKFAKIKVIFLSGAASLFAPTTSWKPSQAKAVKNKQVIDK